MKKLFFLSPMKGDSLALQVLLNAARARVEAMTQEERDAMWEAQRRSIMASVRREIAEGGTC